MTEITSVAPGSRADKAGIRAGDVLLAVNGHAIRDTLDYGFRIADSSLDLELSRGGEVYRTHIDKKTYDDIGLSFATPLMDEKHSCRNGCIFCFIDQLPPGMRPTLYFKDDDERLSFLHGNYITTTNLSEEDIARIIEMHLSPVNISVHTTNPELRVRMMRNKRAGAVMDILHRFADAGLDIRAQIVLCKGWNDGAELDRTMSDLETLAPSLRSVSIVPVGLSGHRQKLTHLEPFTPDECAAVIDQVEARAAVCLKRHGSRLFFCGDEFYVKAKRPLPPEDAYEEYTQLENGVGMLTSFETEVDSALRRLTPEEKNIKRRVSVATGEAAGGFIKRQAEKIKSRCHNFTCNVYTVKNNFFGGEVTVTGLLTAADLGEQLAGRDLGEALYISRSMLRAQGDVFLDDATPEQLSERLGVPVETVENDGAAFVYRLLGLE